MLSIFSYAVYKNFQSKEEVALPMPMDRSSDTNGKTPLIGRVENRKAEFDKCHEAIYEIIRQECVPKTGFDPGEKDSEDVSNWDSLSEDEKSSSIGFWDCYERVSSKETLKCNEMYSDVVESQSQYYKCLGEQPDIVDYCEKVSGYLEDIDAPIEKYKDYSTCIDDESNKQQTNCQSQTGFTP
jgi:hypothetical protein